MLTAKSAAYVADEIVRSRKKVSVYSDYFCLVVFCDRERSNETFLTSFVPSLTVDLTQGCVSVIELITVHSDP
jgi:hypothetical protein